MIDLLLGNIIAEANGLTGATLREMVYLEGIPLSDIDVAASPKKNYAVHVAHLNRPVVLTDATKANVWLAIYEPFGKVHSVPDAANQSLGVRAIGSSWTQASRLAFCLRPAAR